MSAQDAYEYWLRSPLFDENTKAELRAIAGNEEEIRDRFSGELRFGTGGLRGIMGAGTNRMNIYNVGKTTQGLANYIRKQGTQNRGVAIAYDSRHNSREFAIRAGLVLAANGIPVYMFLNQRPTPELSFAVRDLGCTAGIVITASHNPREYNGYKVYWADGAQVTPPRDQDIMQEVDAVSDYGAVRVMDRNTAISRGFYRPIGSEVDDRYCRAVLDVVVAPSGGEDDLTVVYTPLHGTGLLSVLRVLDAAGFSKVHSVPGQDIPNGNFPTVKYPNPEDPKAFAMALDLARKVDADIVLATDPDADRVGVAARDKHGNYFFLTGNMSGALLTEALLSARRAAGRLPRNAAVVKTIVTTKMIEPIAASYGTQVVDVLTGFKYIGQKIKEFEETGALTYVFGFEESYGCLPGTYARDKDGICAVLLLCRLAARCKATGQTLFDALENLYKKYGYYAEGVVSVARDGLAGAEAITRGMTALRAKHPVTLAGQSVVWVRDYQTGRFRNLLTGETAKSNLPVSDVLYFTLEDGSWVCVRPSGTEPKVKLYYGTRGENRDEMEKKRTALLAALDALEPYFS